MNNARQKVDYAGRTVDLLLLKTVLDVPAVNQRVQVDVSDGTDEPRIVTGIEKLVQRYTLLFLNALGSTKFRPDHGTNLIPRAAKGLIYSLATLESAAAEANLFASRQISLADDGDDIPDDERLVASEITDLVFVRTAAKVKISIRLTTAAGQSYVYIIPVNMGIRG